MRGNGDEATRFVELGHVIEDGMAAYPGLPAARVRSLLTHADSRERYDHRAEFTITEVSMVGNVGTYLDSPYHRFADREDLAALPLDRVAGLHGVVVDGRVADDRTVTLPTLDGDAGAVLVRTGWDRRWGTDSYWEPGPFLSADAVEQVLATDAALVGVDFWNVDDPDDPARPAHTGLLDAGVVIVEHLCNLDRLPTVGFRFFATPLRMRGAASLPVRAFAEI